MLFPMVLVQTEMQAASSQIWTWIESISLNDNR